MKCFNTSNFSATTATVIPQKPTAKIINENTIFVTTIYVGDNRPLALLQLDWGATCTFSARMLMHISCLLAFSLLPWLNMLKLQDKTKVPSTAVNKIPYFLLFALNFWGWKYTNAVTNEQKIVYLTLGFRNIIYCSRVRAFIYTRTSRAFIWAKGRDMHAIETNCWCSKSYLT